MEEKYYLTVSRASDLKNKGERRLYRFFEMLPGILSLGALAAAVVASWLFPVGAAFFILTFIIYWLFRNIYFALHLQTGYRRMKKYERIDWLQRLQNIQIWDSKLSIKKWQDIYHLIVIPTYKESVDILRETIMSLRNSDYPKNRMIVVLAIEEREGEDGKKKADLIEKEFSSDFFRFLVTSHPKDIIGETAGKGSNETWALKQAKKKIVDKLSLPYPSIIVSSLDADTTVFPKYLSCLAYHYLTSPDPLHSSFQPIPLFLNNIWQAPAISRVFAFSTSFWYIMNQERPEKLVTFSSHSMSFQALVDVGFKQTNVVSDDSRIFWQCFLKYDGNYRVQPLYYPVSMDANVASSFWGTLGQIYKQQRRWAYGVADVPYFLFGFWKNKKIPLRRKLTFAWELLEGHWSWAVAPILIFLLGWMPLVFGGETFSQSLLSYNLPRFVSRILTISMLGILGVIYVSLVILPPRPPSFGKRKTAMLVLQWFFLPVSMIFLSFPALEAQIRLLLGRYMGFWVTPKFRRDSESKGGVGRK
ncbi:glycosyltransferase family 2 protein [Patescibacteria group bacterium]|nr:glycosyltransferase family 2 protein [Patescibacteria group bacterium]